MSSTSSDKTSPKAETQCLSPKTRLQPCLKTHPSPSPFVFHHSEELLPISPIRPITSPVGELPFQEYEDKENTAQADVGENKSKYCSTPSPLRCYYVSNDDMRHQLLVQRTFHDDCVGPLTSSPLRRPPVTSSPGLTQHLLNIPRSASKDSCPDGYGSASTPRSIFKTPVRGQHRDHAWERTPSAPRTPGLTSPASSLYAFTPGRQFVNPFEMDHERLHMPILTPSMFQVKKKGTESSPENETFWTVDQRAQLMPIEIKESEILRQHFHQTRRDRELDPHFQKAIDQFFANELIVPSPWSEKVSHVLPQTPTGIKSVSCQTSMSVPPDVDLMAEIGEKYHLPSSQLVHESPMDSLAGGFIRRKLLHQLNENDSVVVGASPVLPTKTHDTPNPSISPSLSPTKQVTPEWEKKTPSKKSSGHFSSSPIRLSGDKSHLPLMSESDLLASPELSPIAGRGSNRQMRSSDMFSPHQELERSREIMQLDFSSILDEPDEFDNNQVPDNTETLIQTKGFSLHDHITNVHNASSEFPEPNTRSISNLSHGIDMEAQPSSFNKSSNVLRKSLLTSALSAESTQDTNVQDTDTGYQTASLQSITNIDSVSNLQTDIYPSTSSSNHSFSLMTHAKSKMASLSADSDLSNRNENLSLYSRFTQMPFKSELCMEEGNSLDSYLNSGTRFSSMLSDTNNNSSNKGRNVCRVRKIRTLAEIRRTKEKSTASRDLTSSFNEEAKGSSTIIRLSRSLSNPSLSLDSSAISATVLASPNPGLQKQIKDKSNLDSPLISDKCAKPILDSSLISDKCAKPILALHEGFKFDSGVGDSESNQGFESSGRTSAYLEKRPFENIGTKLGQDVVESDHKHIRLLDSENEQIKENVLFQSEVTPRFSLENTSTLDEARELLGKSEALRMQHDSDSKGHLEMDEFFQYMNEHNDEQGVLGPDSHQNESDKLDSAGYVSLVKLHPVRMSTPDDSMFDSIEEKVNSIEGSKLGSEIAAEILKRAGDDLAQLTSLVGSSSSSKSDP